MLDAETLADLLLAIFAIALGGTLKGATGAGAPVVAVPVLAILFSVELAVVIFVVPNLLTNIWQGWQYRAYRLPVRFTWVYAVGGGLGAVFGSYLLAMVAPKALLLSVAGVVIAYIAFRLARPGWALKQARAFAIVWPAGIAAGVLQGATGVSAPISVTFLNAMQLPRVVFIATISVFFAVMSLVQIPALIWLGLLDVTRLWLGLAAVVPLLLFMPVGNFLAQHVSRQVFDRVILILLALIATRLIWQALG